MMSSQVKAWMRAGEPAGPDKGGDTLMQHQIKSPPGVTPVGTEVGHKYKSGEG